MMVDIKEAQETTAQLELAATVILAPPSQVSHEERKAAEQLFLSFRQSKLAPRLCKYVLESSTNDFLLFEVAQATSSSLLKDWSVTESSVIEGCYKYILQYVAERPHLANFVKRELLICCAKLYKRGIFDQKAGDLDSLCVTVEQLIGSHDQHLQGLGCELIEAVAAEFFSSWRSSGYGITWDFHLRAKRAFETTGLKRLFQLSLRMLHQMATADLESSSYHMSLCEKFLRVAEIVLSWNFASRFLPPRLTYCMETTSAAAALRPPVVWKDIFQNDDLLNLFFQLHGRIRSDESLCERSMNCLVQLSSLMGDVLNAKESDPIDPYDHYLSLYMHNLLQLFSSGPLPSEVTGFCTIWYKLLNFHKVQSFVRFDDAFLSSVLNYMVQYTEHLAPIAMQMALVEDDDTYRVALTKMYEGWLVMVRGFERTGRKGSLKNHTLKIVSSFVRTVLSEPAGQRLSEVPQREYMEDFEQDDRDHFADTLKTIGSFAIYCIDQFLPMLFEILKKKIEQFYEFMRNGVGQKALDVWREDMHWILLFFGFVLTNEDVDGSCHMPSGIYDYCMTMTSLSGKGAPFIRACIENPRAIVDDPSVNLIFRVTGVIMAWCSLEHSMLVEGGAETVSPELMRTSLWVSRRLLAALSAPEDVGDGENHLLVALDANSQFSMFLIQFAFHKTFGVLSKLSGEQKLCKDATDLLLALADNHASEMAASELLYASLSGLQLERLTVRRSLIETLVLIGAAADSAQQQRMYMLILQPLSDKFGELCADVTSNESHIADLLDCFAGVAQAAQQHSAPVLFKFISPILARCVGVFCAKKDSQVLVNAVLDLFAVVTRKLSIYVDAAEDSRFLHQVLLELVEAYKREQLLKYREINVDDEDKAADLLLFLDILGNIMSKDTLLFASLGDMDASNGSRTAFIGLEMLLPLMSEDFLKLPTLCVKFYNLLLYFSEMAPEYLAMMPEQMLISVMECIRRGLQCHFGQEVALISVETLNEMARYFSQDRHSKPHIIMHLSSLVEDVFTTCLEFSCQVDVFNEATFALYALICCNRAAFEAVAMKLLAKEQNAAARSQLEGAFSDLLSGGTVNTTRKEAREFRDRFERFLSCTQGLLVLG
uniref:Exportin-4 n=1 Tax=Parascaris univalens TaxID=6257 RepID=A0A915ATK0_PARUN